MSIHEIILYLMTAFLVVAAVDRIFGSRLGLGKEFEAGILSFGSLALSMLGILVLAPVLAQVLRPVVVPVFRLLGADPGMFPGSILANDMGGAPLALELAEDRNAGLFGGVIVGSMLGATIVFTVPVALGILEPEDRRYLAQGVLAGIVTIPVGALVGGLLAGFGLGMVLRNLLPIVLFAALIALGLWKAEKWMIRGFTVFGKLILAVITVGLTAAIVEELTGFVVIPGLAPLSEGYAVIGSIAIVLAGAFPLVYALTKLLRKPLLKLGRLLGHERGGRRRDGGVAGQLHSHVRHGQGHGPPGQGAQRGLCRLGGLCAGGSPGLHRGLCPGIIAADDCGQAHRRRGGRGCGPGLDKEETPWINRNCAGSF